MHDRINSWGCCHQQKNKVPGVSWEVSLLLLLLPPARWHGAGAGSGNSSKGMGGNSEAPAEKTVACKSYEFESNVILILRLQKYFLFLFQPPGTEGRGEGLVRQSVVTKEHSR